MRVYELAKELNLTSKEVIDLLTRLKVAAKSHSSSLDESAVRRVREQVASRGAGAPVPAPEPLPDRPATKTPTGERIISIRKIAKPVEPPAPEPGEEPQPVAAGGPAEPPREVAADAVDRPAAAVERPAAQAPAAPAAPPHGGEAAPPIRIAPVKPPPREAHRETLTPEQIARELFGPAPPAPPAPAPPAPPETPPRTETRPAKPEPRRPERRLPPPPPPRRFHAERRRRHARKTVEPPSEVAPAGPGEIELSGPVAVGDLAARLGMGVPDIVRRLLEFGMLAGINQQLSQEVATRVADSFGATVRQPAEAAARAPTRRPAEAEEGAEVRSPVVTVMGHVDHGKTSLLDAIRATAVADHEFGGITQHIGASTVEVDGRTVVFIDTPGHAAFTALRARGAQVTDIAILVVAADDGVMPQTVEAVNHARAAGVPIIVAVNKTDLPQANPDRVKQQLADLGLLAEDWGGETVTVPVSARQRTGLKELLEMILLVADMHELRANPNKPARGTVLEARMDRGRGPVATVLIAEGTLNVGDAVVTGETFGRVRALMGERGERLTLAGPATAVEVLGLEAVPSAGDLLEAVRDERLAKAVVEERSERRRAAEAVTRPGVMEERLDEEGRRELRLIIKGDVHGSVEALQAALARLETPEVALTLLHTGVGPITESDVMLAAASRAVIIGFNVRPDAAVRRIAEQEKVDLRLHRLIYEALDDLSALLRGMAAPKMQEVVLGQAEVRQTFAMRRVGTIAGCYVTSGRIVRGASARLLREGAVVYQGALASLRRFKDDVREVTEGFECGIGLERFQDVKVGDIIEAYETQEVPA